MIRTLLATTAIAAVLTGGVYAQQEQPAGQDEQLQQGEQQTMQQQGQQQTMQNEVYLEDGMTIVIPAQTQQDFTIHFRVDAMGQQGSADAAQSQQQQQTGQATTQRQDMQATEANQLSADELTDANVYGANEDNIGNVNDVILTAEGEVDAIIVDVGGFLGIGSRQVAIGLDNLELMVDNNNNWHVYTPFTQEQLEAQPEYDAQNYTQQRDDQRLINQ